MEYNNPYLALGGGVVFLLWVLDYFKIIQPRLILGGRNASSPNWFKLMRLTLFVMGVIAWGNIIYGLSEPREQKSTAPSSRKVIDIFLVVDVSRSMLADDLRPNRLEVAKTKLREFAKLRPTDRIGVILFSEKVFTLLPLSTDPELLDRVIGDINVGFLGSGTNIGDALALAVARGVDSETENKVIVLLTDGVNNVGNISPMQAAQAAKDNEMKVYTIGLGGDEDARLPLGNSIFGQQYQKIPGGSIDYEELKKMATLTGGKFFPAKNEHSLEEVLNEIQNLEKTDVNVSNIAVYDEQYYQYLFIGILLLVAVELVRKVVLREVI